MDQQIVLPTPVLAALPRAEHMVTDLDVSFPKVNNLRASRQRAPYFHLHLLLCEIAPDLPALPDVACA